jgi:hypothetical protein
MVQMIQLQQQEQYKNNKVNNPVQLQMKWHGHGILSVVDTFIP